VSVTDADADVFVTCLLDDVATMSSDGEIEGELPPCGEPHQLRNLSEGPHALAVLAIDDHGNFHADAVDFIVDTTPPTLTVSGVTEGQVVSVDDPPLAPSCTATDAVRGWPVRATERS
jgi:hypothetical protein